MVMFNTCFIQINNNIPYIHVALSLVSKDISSRFSVETTKPPPPPQNVLNNSSFLPFASGCSCVTRDNSK